MDKLKSDVDFEIRHELKKQPFSHWKMGTTYCYDLGRTFRITYLTPQDVHVAVFCFGDPVLRLHIPNPQWGQ